MKQTLKEWAKGNFNAAVEPEKSFERTAVFRRSPDELLNGLTVKEVDIEVDTIPGELLELLNRR